MLNGYFFDIKLTKAKPDGKNYLENKFNLKGINMNKTEVRSIIEATLKSGSKTPGLFDLPKILRVKSKLESCASIDEVIVMLESNRDLISKSFSLSDVAFNESVKKLNELKTTA